MNIPSILTTLILSIIAILLYSIHRQIKHFVSDVCTSHVDSAPDEHVKPELTQYEKIKLAREEEFDERIRRLRSDVYLDVPSHTSPDEHAVRVAQRGGTVAEELHPGVHNLPHDSIISKYDSPNYVEVAE